MDYRQFYDLETYLFETVRQRFTTSGSLSAFDFFCIVVWKANRAKTRIAKKLIKHGHDSLETSVQALTGGLNAASSSAERLRLLWETWEINLPMATAILSVLYPDEFTVYDQRVCGVLRDHHGVEFGTLGNLSRFDAIWPQYQRYVRAVEAAVPLELALRDKDRYLWGRSFFEQLSQQVRLEFRREGIRG